MILRDRGISWCCKQSKCNLCVSRCSGKTSEDWQQPGLWVVNSVSSAVVSLGFLSGLPLRCWKNLHCEALKCPLKNVRFYRLCEKARLIHSVSDFSKKEFGSVGYIQWTVYFLYTFVNVCYYGWIYCTSGQMRAGRSYDGKCVMSPNPIYK